MDNNNVHVRLTEHGQITKSYQKPSSIILEAARLKKNKRKKMLSVHINILGIHIKNCFKLFNFLMKLEFLVITTIEFDKSLLHIYSEISI